MVDLSQKYNNFAMFLKNSWRNICKIGTNPLPLHSLSLQNEVVSAFFDRMGQARKQRGARGKSTCSPPCKEQEKKTRLDIQCRV